MRVKVRLFATYREIIEQRQLTWTAKEGETLAGLVDSIIAKYPRLTGYRGAMLLAVNASYALPETVLRDGDEVALMPPVSGGRP